jgi:hypothetical protein
MRRVLEMRQEERRQLIRRNVLLVLSYLLVMGLLVGAYA